ncbi:MAG: hypothetical protein AB7P99_07040 [Vicinamibacterales bacterium]
MTKAIARVISAVLVLCVAAAAHAKEERPAQELAIDGAGTLPLAGYAKRTYLLGTLEVYGVAIYAEGLVDRERLASADVATDAGARRTCAASSRHYSKTTSCSSSTHPAGARPCASAAA